jgi:hypothetical protein
MALDVKQADWLSRASGITVLVAGSEKDDGRDLLARKLAEEEIADQEKKTLMIDDAMRVIGPLKPMLSEAFDLQIKNKKGKTKQLQAKDGALANTAETRQITGTDTISRGGSKAPKKGEPTGPDPAVLVQEAGRAYHMIEQIKIRLEKETTTRSQLKAGTLELFDGPKQKLFTISEITDELYTPLIRERILPDTIVQGKFSKVQQMLDATNELYKEELKDAEDPDGGAAGLIKSMVSFGHDLAAPILQAAGVDTTLAKTLLEGCTALAEITVDLGDKIHAGLDVDSLSSFINTLPAIAGGLVSTATGDKSLGGLVTTAATAGTAGVSVFMTSIKAKKADTKGFVTFFSAFLSAGLAGISPGTETGKALVKDFDGFQKLVAKAAGEHAQDFFDALAAGDMKRARSACKGVCVDVAIALPSMTANIVETVNAVEKDKLPKDDEPKTQEQLAEEKKKLAEEKKQSKGIEIAGDLPDKVKEQLDQYNEAKEALKKKLAEQADSESAEKEAEIDQAEEDREKLKKDPEKYAARLQKELEEERKAFTDQLNGLNDPTTDPKTVMKLIAKIQKDRAILAVAVAIGTGGIDAASHFFGPLAMATEAIKMAMNIAAAVERAAYLRKFVDEQAGAANATSPYMTSIENFVENQANQLTHYAIAAALNGVKIAAAAAATAYPAAAPAVPIVAAVQSATEAVYAFYNANQVRKAWDVTKAALSDPQDRALGLKARKVNPTLAKYAIAYGSTVERDPVAVSMASACGLDNETLKNKDTNVLKVKMYLEIRFSDDNKVVGKWEDPAAWTAKLPEPELHAGAVFQTYKIVTDQLGKTDEYKAVLKEGKATPPSDLIALIRMLEKQKLPEPPTIELVTERLSVVGRVKQGFLTEKAKLGEIDENVDAALEAFADAADHEQEIVVMQLIKLKVEAAKPTTH